MKNKKGFTLIELIAVLVILAILALIVTLLVLNIIKKTKESADKRSIDAYGRSVEIAISNYVIETGKFPQSIEELQIEYRGNEVVCGKKIINENYSIYLTECRVNGKEVKDEEEKDGYYHYGKYIPPIAVNYLIKKANDINTENYTAGNKNEMYTFSHEKTDQTPEEIDYRYIGNIPNNYVEFNDELWRIIGVFETEDENGHYKKRLKIISSSTVNESIKWSNFGVNNWGMSTLGSYLNSEYYNSLSEDSQEMIDKVKYYTAGHGESRDMAENFYHNERGTAIYESYTINGFNYIGLIYASDYFYTYALGVDDMCFSNARECSSSNPLTSWMYIGKNEWTIVPHVWGGGLDPFYNFYIGPEGGIGSNASDKLKEARATLYLKADIKIADGDGTSNNPYILLND